MQTDQDFEVVIADDASTDDTSSVLARTEEPRVRVIRHDRNKGMSAARATTVEHARGDWFVMLDSDDELLPHALARLRSLIAVLPQDVRIIRSCFERDDGSVSPSILPDGVTDYEGRLKWLDAVSAQTGSLCDAGHCMHRDVFASVNHFTERRDDVSLWEADLARVDRSLWVSDILGRVHTDAANSMLRDADLDRLLHRLLGDAADQQLMIETMLSKHAAGLAMYAPCHRRSLLRRAAAESLLAGDRSSGIRHSWAAWRVGVPAAQVWPALVLGLVDPTLLVAAKFAARRIRSSRAFAAAERVLRRHNHAS